MKTPFVKKEKKEEEIQYNLGFNEPYSNKLAALKQRLSLTVKRLETSAFIRDFSNWFYIFVSLSLILVQFNYLRISYKILPSEIPLYQYLIDLSDKLVSKEWIYLIPAFSIIIFLVSTIASYTWYNRKRDIAEYTLLFMFISLLILTISLAKIIAVYYG